MEGMEEMIVYGERASFFLLGLVTALIILDLILIAATAILKWQTKKLDKKMEESDGKV